MTNREQQLEQEIRAKGGIPRHIAVIMDGNGRWARSRTLPRLDGHAAGVTSVRETVRGSAELGVEFLTLYAFSVENWNRPKVEVAGLMRVLKDTLRGEREELNRNNVQLRIIGHEEDLPADVRSTIDETRDALASNTGLVLLLALSYGGRPEIVDAARCAARRVKEGTLDPDQITVESFGQMLSTAEVPDPDLLIRTSGEMRISNFLLWQIAYSEIWVTRTHWPDFRRVHLYEGIREYQKRDRRFGRVESAGESPGSDLMPSLDPGE
ncbi:MAG: isoprenyl transferase [Gemmatimonadota bacterium]|nr:isoprenyl transferase [Gemmatimonadota bacterium]MDP6802416.1 isoprenyl transferase [Gemmatimonadota bacterium]